MRSTLVFKLPKGVTQMLEILSFIDELNDLYSKTVDLTAKRQISSVIDKYQKIADDMDRRMFDEYNGEDNAIT